MSLVKKCLQELSFTIRPNLARGWNKKPLRLKNITIVRDSQKIDILSSETLDATALDFKNEKQGGMN